MVAVNSIAFEGRPRTGKYSPCCKSNGADPDIGIHSDLVSVMVMVPGGHVGDCVGSSVGEVVGPDVGEVVGRLLGLEVSGAKDGEVVGIDVGEGVGFGVGPVVGLVVGAFVGGCSQYSIVPHGWTPVHETAALPDAPFLPARTLINASTVTRGDEIDST